MTSDLCSATLEPGLIARTLADTDCQAVGLVERGYSALASPESATAAMLTAMLVIAVAFFGYRLMLGRGLVLADLTRLVIRIGVVLLLAASWSTVQGVVYDTLARAPTRIAEQLIVSIDAPAPLEGVQVALDKIDQASVGWRQRAGIASPLVGGPPTAAMTLNVAAFLLTITTLGLLVVSRIVLALLLALTPVVAGFLLFDATRGLLEGWLRALVAAALVPLGVLTLAAIEMALVIPILDRILTEEAGGQFLENSVTPLGLVTTVFAIAILASLGVLRSIARGIRLSGSPTAVTRTVTERTPDHGRAGSSAIGAQSASAGTAQPQVVRALASLQRRDAPPLAPRSERGFAGLVRPVGTARQDGSSSPVGPREFAGIAAPPPLRQPLRNRASRAARRREL